MRHATKRKMTAALVVGTLIGGLSACHKEESTASLLAEAKQYQQKGDTKAALIQLKNAVEKSPEDGEARMQLATLDWEMGDAVSAEKELRKARSLGVPEDRVLPLLSKVMLQQNHAKEILEEISAEKAANSAPLLTTRAYALWATGSEAEAKAVFDQALILDPKNGDAMLGLARLAMKNGDQEASSRYLADAVAKDPKNADVWMANGSMLRTQNKTADALAAYDQVLKLKPDHRSAHIEKAYIYITGGKFPEAKAELDAARKTAPNDLAVTYTQALYEFSQGKYAAAHEGLQKILKVAPTHLPSVLLSGASELNLGSIQQAERHLRFYLENNPNNVYARKLLAQTLLKSSQPGDAAAALAPVLKDATEDPQLLALAGESYMQARDFDKASTYFEKAATLAPKAAAVRTSLGLSKMAKGDQAGGLSELELATTLDPKSPRALMALIQTEIGLKHYDKALAAVQTLEKQQPDNAQVQNIKGGVYIMKGDTANARAAFERAASLQPGFMPAVSNLARMDLQENKPDAARKRFEQLLEKDKNNAAAMMALGDLAMLQKKPDEATSWFEKASNVSSDTIAPALKLGAHYLQIKQPEKAVTLARKLQTANATNADLLDLLGKAQVMTKDLPGALETYSKLANVQPKSAQAQMRLASVHTLMKKDAEAAAAVKRAVELQPDFLPARLAQVELAARGGRMDEALGLAHDLQKQQPASPVGYAVEGDLLMAQRKAAPAAAAYTKAMEHSTSSEIAIKALTALNAAGKGKEAQARAQQWLKDHPKDLRMSVYVAELNLANKDYKGAVSLLQGVQKAVPNDPVVLNNLAWAYQQLKDPRALETAEQAVKFAGESPSVMDTLGWMLVEQGNTARGLPILQKASALAPDAPEIRYHLAVGLNKSGDKQRARQELDKLLAQNRPFAQIDEARALLKTL